MLFCFNFIWKGCFKKMHHLFFRVRANDVNSTKSQPKIFIWWINKMTNDKRWQAKFSGIVLRWKQFLSLKNCRSVSICSVLNRSNRDTTVYYLLIFCAFSWPNMVKWRNSGIISALICMCESKEESELLGEVLRKWGRIVANARVTKSLFPDGFTVCHSHNIT